MADLNIYGFPRPILLFNNALSRCRSAGIPLRYPCVGAQGSPYRSSYMKGGTPVMLFIDSNEDLWLSLFT